MLTAVGILLACQLCGEVIARALALPLPGPVLGLALLATLFVLRPALFDQVSETTRIILSHLSLLFVPAGVGVVASLDLLRLRPKSFGLWASSPMNVLSRTRSLTILEARTPPFGQPSLTVVLMVLTGITGAVIVTPLMSAMHIRAWRARGCAVGSE